MSKPALMLLCHRIPYPPNKGDKIRAFHLLSYLVQHYRVYLGTFVDDPDDWQHTQALEALCEECLFVDLNPTRAKLRCLSGLVTGQALSVPYYANASLQRWVDQRLEQSGINRLVAVSSPMAQFALQAKHSVTHQVIDLVDIDSDKWQQYAQQKSFPMNWVYRREAKQLQAYEAEITQFFDKSLFVSSAEADLFKQKLPALADKVDYYNNGVDNAFFSPQREYPRLFSAEQFAVVFTGAMDYWPNVDAVCWFANHVMPLLRKAMVDVHFYIVGSKPTETVLQLAQANDITVTGRVEDVRPYIYHAGAVIAPMRIARGIQNKVLEGMAMAKPVVVSDMGLEGIKAHDQQEVLVANTAQEYVEALLAIRDGRAGTLGAAARARVMKDFSWEESLPIVRQILEQGTQVEYAAGS